MNEQIKQGAREGVKLTLGTLGIGNGIIDGALQFPSVSAGKSKPGGYEPVGITKCAVSEIRHGKYIRNPSH